MNKNKFITVLSIVLVLHIIFIQACATVCQPGPDMIPVNSLPDNADVYLDGLIVGRTPLTVSVDRTSECYIEVKKDGYKPIIVDRDKKLAGWFLPGNLLWLLLWPGFPVAIIVDLASSNQGKYSTDAINVHLSETTGAQDSSVSEQIGSKDSLSVQSPSDEDIERLKAQRELLKMKLEVKKLEQELLTKTEKLPTVQATPQPITNTPSIIQSTPILIEETD